MSLRGLRSMFMLLDHPRTPVWNTLVRGGLLVVAVLPVAVCWQDCSCCLLGRCCVCLFFVYLCVCFFVCLFVCLFVSFFATCFFDLCLFGSLIFVSLIFVCLFVCLFVCFFDLCFFDLCLFVCLFVCLLDCTRAWRGFGVVVLLLNPFL